LLVVGCWLLVDYQLSVISAYQHNSSVIPTEAQRSGGICCLHRLPRMLQIN
jgi:hypothetical protein